MNKEVEDAFSTVPPMAINLTFDQAAEEQKKLKEKPDMVKKESDFRKNNKLLLIF